jgi:hypothetical protein
VIEGVGGTEVLGSGIKLAAAAIVEVSCGGAVASGVGVAAGVHPARVATMTNVNAKRFLWVMIPLGSSRSAMGAAAGSLDHTMRPAG